MCLGPPFPSQGEGQLEHLLWCSAQSDCLCSDDQAHVQTFPPKVSLTSLECHLVTPIMWGFLDDDIYVTIMSGLGV